MTNARYFALVLFPVVVACTGGGQPEPDPATNEDLDPDIAHETGCEANVEEVGLDDVVEGFDATPAEALAALEGAWVGSDAERSVALDLVLDGTVQVVRQEPAEPADGAPEPAFDVMSYCPDYLLLPGTLELDAGEELGLTAAVEIAYYQGEDAGDGFGWDTAMFSVYSETWEGSASPSWDPAEMESIEVVISGYWQGGTHVDGTGRTFTETDEPQLMLSASFFGASLPSGTDEDATVWAAEEILFDLELEAQ